MKIAPFRFLFVSSRSKKSLNAQGILRTAWGGGVIGLICLLGAGQARSADCVSPPMGLVSWWQAESNANDAMNQNPGTFINGAGTSVGQVGQAFTFDGVDDYLEVASSSSLNPTGSFSIEGWIFPRQDRVQSIMSKWTDWEGERNQRSYCFITSSNRALTFAISDWAHQWDRSFHAFDTTNNVITTNAWNHVAAVYDQAAGARLIYVNGVKVAERIDPPITVTNSTAKVAIGAQFASGPAAYHFDGLIDELSFYSAALSAAQIQAIYIAGSAGKCLSPPNCTAPPMGLVSWWQAESNANDAMNQNPGTFINGAGTSVGQAGQAFDFNGVNQFVIVPSSTNLNPAASFSIEGWIYPRQDGPQAIMSKWTHTTAEPNQRSYAFVADANRVLVFAISDWAHAWDTAFHRFVTTNNVFDLNTWSHVAAVYDQVAGARRIYVNGVQVAERIDTPITVTNTTAAVGIGAHSPAGPAESFFDGLIDELSFYSAALSAAQIQAIYIAGSAGKCLSPPNCTAPPSGLVAWWPGEGNAGDIAGTNNGALLNGTTFAPGVAGSAFSFYGGLDKVLVPDSPSLRLTTELTVEAWIKPRSLPTNDGSVVSKVGPSGGHNGYALYVSIDNMLAGQFNRPGQAWPGNVIIHTNRTAIVPGSWHHVAWTYDQSAMKLYLNGLPVATNVIGPQAIAVSPNSACIGGVDENNPVGFNGLIDEPSVYSRALSDEEIALIYNASSGGKCAVASITSQPQDETAVVGSTVTFSVSAGGTPPLSYQWQFNSTNIAGATASSLTLTNVQPDQAGSYLVIVSNALGVATSANAVLAVVPPPPCVTPAAGLVAWWPGDGNAYDMAGTNRGTLSGGATFASGKVGQAFSFDGVNGTVVVPDSSSLRLTTQLTVEAWVNTRTISANVDQAIVCKVGIANGNKGYALALNGVSLWAAFNSPGQNWPGNVITYANSSAIVANVWLHVAWTYDQSAMKLYLNGLPVATNVIGPRAIAVSSTDVRISGADNHVYFDGLIDEPGIYNRALSASEIAAIYASGSTGKCPAPAIISEPRAQVGYWGKSVTFTVHALGEAPLYYQWLRDGIPIEGASESSLVLTDLEMTDGGNYSVVVTNAYGSVTSSSGYLTMNPAGVSIDLYAGVTIDGVPGLTYGVQQTTDLSDTNSWKGAANVTLSVPTMLWFDVYPATQPQRYYRVVPGPISVP